MTQIHSKKLHNMWACLKRWHTCVLGREKEGGCSGADFSTNQFLRPPPPRLPLLLPCWCSEWPTALLQGYNCLHHHQHQSPPTSREHLLQ